MSQSRIAAFFTSLSFFVIAALVAGVVVGALVQGCLLYTSDAADE